MQTIRVAVMRARTRQIPNAQRAVDMKSTEPTAAAIVREQTGLAWSRARRLCAEGRVTVNGRRCLEPASRVSLGAVVIVDERALKLSTRPLAESAIVFSDRDVVVVDKPVGMLSVADEPGNKDTLVDHTRTLLRSIGGHGMNAKLGVVHRLDKDTSGLMDEPSGFVARKGGAEAHHPQAPQGANPDRSHESEGRSSPVRVAKPEGAIATTVAKPSVRPTPSGPS